MFRSKMDLRIKLLALPFTEFEFYIKDQLEKIVSEQITFIGSTYELKKKYKSSMEEDLLPLIYRVLHRTQRIENLDEIDLLVRKYYPIYSIIELYKINKSNTMFYIDHLTKLSRCFLTHRNGKISLKYWESRGTDNYLEPYSGIHKIVLWNSLNRMFTTDILVILYLLDNNMTDENYLRGYHSLVAVEDLQLEQVLKEGLAETHLHMNAGINFIVSWQELMTLSINKRKQKRNIYTLLDDQDKVLGKQLFLSEYVKAMSIVRMSIAKYLNDSYSSSVNYTSLYDYYSSSGSIEGVLLKILIDVFEGADIKEKRYDFFKIYDDLKLHWNISEDLSGQIDNDWNYLLIKKDIISSIFNLNINYTTTENIFIFRAVKYIKDNMSDTFFSKIFWQYIRVKNEVFQLKVQGNLIRGLKYFSDYYVRSTQRAYSSKEYLGLILYSQIQSNNLKKLELRLSVDYGKNYRDVKKSLLKRLLNFFDVYYEILKGDKFDQIPIIGLVFHFIKQEDFWEYDKCWKNYVNNKEPGELYFKELQQHYEMQITAINELREKIPGLANYLVGIDAAAVENDTEPWVFAPIYEIARNSDTHKPIYISTGKPIKNLGFTFHAGEDFRHILTGLRRIDEVIDHFKFHAGDRIGHGIALGISTKKWVENNRIVTLPRLEYIENLLWIWGVYKNGKYTKRFDIGFLEQEIMGHAERIYENMEGVTIYNLWKAYQNKFKIFQSFEKYKDDFNDLHKKHLFCHYVDKMHTYIWNAEKLTLAQHCRCYLIKMLEPIQVEVKMEDIEILNDIQKIVKSKVSKNGIIIETNPTSNVAIGEIESLFEHYIYNLNAKGLKGNSCNEDEVIVTINSDDPSVFNTNVSNEFGFIFYALQEKGYAREDILDWIDKVRKNGLRGSFIENRNLSHKDLIDDIEDIIKHLRNYK